MSFIQQLILDVPAIFLCTTIVTISIILSTGGILIVRHFIPHNRLKVHNDVAAAIFAVMGVIYAVLLAFTVIVTWENFSRANLNVEKEANFLADLYRDSESFQEPSKQQIRTLISEYGKSVVNEEWGMLAIGKTSPETHKIVNEIWLFYNDYFPKTITEQIFFEESIRKLNEMCELRRLRLFESRAGIDPILWLVLISGGVFVIAFTFFFGSENLGAQIAMSSLLAALIAIILFTILEFNFPFNGDTSVSCEPFKQLLSLL